MNKLFETDIQNMQNAYQISKIKYPIDMEEPYRFETPLFVNNMTQINTTIQWLRANVCTFDGNTMFPLRIIHTPKWFLCWPTNFPQYEPKHLDELAYLRFTNKDDQLLFTMTWL